MLNGHGDDIYKSNTEIKANFSTNVWYDADTGETVLAGEFFSPANENTAVGRVRVSTGAHKLFLLKLHVGGETVVNHYLHGKPPFDLEKYRSYLRQIAALDRSFDADSVAK